MRIFEVLFGRGKRERKREVLFFVPHRGYPFWGKLVFEGEGIARMVREPLVYVGQGSRIFTEEAVWRVRRRKGDVLFLEKVSPFRHRRNYVRVYPPTNVKVRTCGGEGILADVSEGGAGVLYPYPPEVLPSSSCFLSFSLEGRKLRLEAVVRYVVPSENRWRAGFEFTDLSEEDRKFLREYVFRRQRQILREMGEGT